MLWGTLGRIEYFQHVSEGNVERQLFSEPWKRLGLGPAKMRKAHGQELIAVTCGRMEESKKYSTE